VSRALADLDRLKWEAMIGSGVLAAVLGLAAFLSWRTFVRPLQALSRTSERMASGDPGETVKPGGPWEIAHLASVFNRMSLALRDSHETLESRIEERTRQLEESREFLELLLDSIDQRVVVVNRDYEIIKANTAATRMHGCALVGERCFDVFEAFAEPPEDYPARRTFETRQVASAERSQKTVRGREAVYVETYPVFDSEGRVESVVEIGRVVTAEKQLQMQMVYQEKMAAFGQLAAGIAHEIGNPLTAIDSQLRMAEEDPGRAGQTLAIVRKQVGRMDRMLRRLVNFTRRKRDEVTLTSVNQIVDDVAQLLEHDPRAPKIAIDRKLSENLPGIRAKEDDLVQVLLNLGINALDAVGEHGSVEFSTSVEEGSVTIRVRDTGSGVSEGARVNLFDPFFTTKGPGRGTGLGLFVSKGIIAAIGGDLELERSGPEGTTFVIRVPVESAGLDGEGI
jgi:C4-dicarboxylate-specific signal transduction histidine kinase